MAGEYQVGVKVVRGYDFGAVSGDVKCFENKVAAAINGISSGKIRFLDVTHYGSDQQVAVIVYDT